MSRSVPHILFPKARRLTVETVIYDPPRDGLPYLVVTLDPDGQVRVKEAKTKADAQFLLRVMTRGFDPTIEL